MSVSDGSSFVTFFGVLFTSFYIYAKSLSHAPSLKRKALTCFWCFLWAVGYIFTSMLVISPYACAASVFFIQRMTKEKLDTIVSAYLLSYGISYSMLYIATIILGMAFAPFLGQNFTADMLINFNEPIYFLFCIFISIFQFLLAFLFFRVRRFKKGFPFLFKENAVVVALIVAGFVFIAALLISAPYEKNGNFILYSMTVGVLIIGAGIYIWIRRGIKMFFRKKQVERAIESLENELTEKNEEILRLTEQNDALRIATHNTTHRLAALEKGVRGLIALHQRSAEPEEISGELSVMLEDILRLSGAYNTEIAEIKGKRPLPSTRVPAIDSLFTYFAEKFADNKITFHLWVNGSIPYMTEKIIRQEKLEVIIGNHLQNALDAVSASENSCRSVLALLGIAEGVYEFQVYDSGVLFKTDTLVRLGTERVTTHAAEGGSGIGFMTTFKIIRECGASLFIHEEEPGLTDYSKSVTVRFDGKNQYIVETYRPEAFPTRPGLIVRGY